VVLLGMVLGVVLLGVVLGLILLGLILLGVILWLSDRSSENVVFGAFIFEFFFSLVALSEPALYFVEPSSLVGLV